MKVNGIKIRRKVMEYINGKMVQFIKVSLKIIKSMEKVKRPGRMDRAIKEIGVIINAKVKEI